MCGVSQSETWDTRLSCRVAEGSSQKRDRMSQAAQLRRRTVRYEAPVLRTTGTLRLRHRAHETHPAKSRGRFARTGSRPVF